MTTTAVETTRLADLRLQVRIAASPAAVWKALTTDIAEWWPSSFYCGTGGSEGSRGRFYLEAHPGGRMWEDWGNGDGLLWATVANVVEGKTLQLTGTMGTEWGGPSTWYGGFGLAAKGEGTELTYSESGFGRIPDNAMEEKEKGWRFLFATLQAHLEGTQPPVWDDSGSST